MVENISKEERRGFQLLAGQLFRIFIFLEVAVSHLISVEAIMFRIYTFGFKLLADTVIKSDLRWM